MELTNNNYNQAIEQLNEWAYAYYTLDNPIATDSMYDELYFKVKKFEEDNDIINQLSPTQRVGGKVLNGFNKAKHLVKMYSLDDVFNPEEFLTWAKKIKDVHPNAQFESEPKYDGLSLNILYDEGILQKAITRGDGLEGEDVTKNIPYIKGIPLNIPFKEKIEIRGEVTIFKSDFPEVNRLRVNSGKEEFSNERNAASGSLRNYDSKAVKNSNLKFSPYGIGFSDKEFETQNSSYEFIIEQGFVNWGTNCTQYVHSDPNKIIEEYRNMIDNRDSYPMLLDGLVVKVNQISIQKSLGFATKYPKWGIAFKFPAEETKTKLLDVIMQVGKTGAITPVAEVEAVDMQGTIVRRATLHNFEEIQRFDYKIGDTVTIIKSGDVIPKLLGVDKLLRDGSEIDIIIPETCPTCGSKTEKRKKLNSTEDSTALYCSNKKCPDVIKGRISYAISKKAFNIDGVSESAINELYDKELIRNVADLFKITIEDLLTLNGFKERKAQKTFNSIQSVISNVTMSKFINALDIELIGERASDKISKNQRAVELILGIEGNPSIEDFNSIDDIGEAMSKNILSFIEYNKSEVKELFEAINPIIPNWDKDNEIEESFFTNKKVVITGTLSKPRDYFKELLTSKGAIIGNSISKKTDFLLAGESAGSKKAKAESYGVEIIDEQTLNERL